MSPDIIPPSARAPVHALFELLGYAAAAWLYVRARRRQGDLLPDSARSTVVCASFVGAALGARLLALLEHPQTFHWQSLLLLDGGRTIIGGIFGGWIAVELVKRHYRINPRTGDLFVTPLYSFDVRSIKKTCVHIVHPDGRLIPFDNYNLFYRDELEHTRLAALRAGIGAEHVQ